MKRLPFERELMDLTALAASVSFSAALLLMPASAYADDDAAALAKAKYCTTCHSIDKKVAGPAYKDVAQKYAGNPKAEAELIEKVLKGSRGVWGPTPMPPNSTVKPEEAARLVKWILSLK